MTDNLQHNFVLAAQSERFPARKSMFEALSAAFPRWPVLAAELAPLDKIKYLHRAELNLLTLPKDMLYEGKRLYGDLIKQGLDETYATLALPKLVRDIHESRMTYPYTSEEADKMLLTRIAAEKACFSNMAHPLGWIACYETALFQHALGKDMPAAIDALKRYAALNADETSGEAALLLASHIEHENNLSPAVRHVELPKMDSGKDKPSYKDLTAEPS